MNGRSMEHCLGSLWVLLGSFPVGSSQLEPGKQSDATRHNLARARTCLYAAYQAPSLSGAPFRFAAR